MTIGSSRAGSTLRDSPVAVGLGYLTIEGAHPVEHIEAAAAHGFAHVGLRVHAPTGLEVAHDIVGDASLRRAIRAAQARTGVAVLDVDVLTLAAASDMNVLGRAMDAAADIGAAIVQVVIEDPERARAVDRFAALCDRAAPLGLAVAVEFMRWRRVCSVQDASAFVREAGRANAHVCLDCLHLSRCGNGPDDVAALPRGTIGYVQLCDAPAMMPPEEGIIAEARAGRRFPGEGELWLDRLLDTLPADVPWSLEVPRAEDAGRRADERARLAAEATLRFLTHRAIA